MFIEGDYVWFQHAHVEVPRLLPGEYIIFIKAEWESLNPVRKLVTNLYCEEDVKLERVNTEKYPLSIFAMMEEWLSDRLRAGASYEVPVNSGID